MITLCSTLPIFQILANSLSQKCDIDLVPYDSKQDISVCWNSCVLRYTLFRERWFI